MSERLRRLWRELTLVEIDFWASRVTVRSERGKVVVDMSSDRGHVGRLVLHPDVASDLSRAIAAALAGEEE